MTRFLYAERLSEHVVEIHMSINDEEYTFVAPYFILLNDLGINLLTHEIVERDPAQ